MGEIDAALAACLKGELTPRAASVRHILRLGAAQLLFLDTPPHAAVDTAVALATGRPRGAYAGLVNAVLRRLSGQGKALLAGLDGARLNTPGWLWQSWTHAYGEPTARAIAAALLHEAPLDLSVKDDAAGWATRLDATILPFGSLRRPAGGLIAELPGYAEGAWWVQDAAATLPARLLGDVAGRRVIDLCAAPGGKTAQLAAAGAEVTAVDRSPARMKRLAANLARLRLAAEPIVADATTWRPSAPAALVLLDAPCTATGTIRRHPDIARLRSPRDLAPLVASQDRLLAAALEMLAPGGILVYCVCSLEPEEGPERIAALLAHSPGVARRPVVPTEIGGLEELVTPAGDLRTLPSHLAALGGLDGFYAARLQRR
jgi:16S rRNA (cytosine967-C5)-methyltransferase